MIHLSGEKFMQGAGIVNLKKRRRTSFNILSDHYPPAQLVLWKIEIMCFNMLQLFSLASSCALFSVYDSTVSPSSPKK